MENPFLTKQYNRNTAHMFTMFPPKKSGKL